MRRRETEGASKQTCVGKQASREASKLADTTHASKAGMLVDTQTECKCKAIEQALSWHKHAHETSNAKTPLLLPICRFGQVPSDNYGLPSSDDGEFIPAPSQPKKKKRTLQRVPSLLDPIPDDEPLPTEDLGGEGASSSKQAPTSSKLVRNLVTAQIVKTLDIALYTRTEVQNIVKIEEQLGRADFMEIFSPPRLSPLFASLGRSTAPAIDVLLRWDVCNSKMRAAVMDIIRARRPRVIMLSPPCTVFSTLQNLCKGRISEGVQRVKRAEGQALLRFAMVVATRQCRENRKFAFEHPTSATSWREPCVRKLLSRSTVKVAAFHQCCFGLRSKVKQDLQLKPTSIMTNSNHIFEAFNGKMCSGDHVHQPIIGQEGGMSRSSWAACYPPDLCSALVSACLKELA